MSKQLEGIVEKVSGDKTLKVRLDYLWTHPVYQKQYKRNKSVLVHAEDVTKYKAGDKVNIKPARKRSKMKHYEVC